MPAPDTITVPQLSRLVGTPDAPTILDVRTEEDFAADPRTLPGTVRRDWQAASAWSAEYAGRPVAVVCQRGLKLSQGVAAWLRHAGTRAEALEGGFEAWAATLAQPSSARTACRLVTRRAAPSGSRAPGPRWTA